MIDITVMTFTHPALYQDQKKPLIYTAHSKHFFYFRAHISKFVLEQGAVPLNPFMLFDYFLIDSVERDTVRSANNSLVERADELWVFGPVSNGVLAEIMLAQKHGVTIKYFAIEIPHTIVPITADQANMESGVEEYKHLLLIEPPPKKGPGKTIRQAQEDIDEWVHTVGVRPFSPLTNLGVLTEEVGEVARLLIRIHGDQSFKDPSEAANLSDELADVLFSLICIANQNDVNLEKALKKNIEKKTNRDTDRHQQNPKLHIPS